jgi:hypothetical protein
MSPELLAQIKVYEQLVDNIPSNALGHKAGFSLVEECDFEYPKGHLMRSNNWCLDLTPDKSRP